MSSHQRDDVSVATQPGPGSGDHEHEPVPAGERRGWLPIALVWIAIGIDISGLLLGAELGAGIDFGSAILAIVLGSLALGVLAALCAWVGASANLSTPMIARLCFGQAGAKVLSLIIALSMVGWFGVQAGFFAVNLSAIVDDVTGVELSVKWLALAGGLLMMTTAFAFRTMSRLSSWSVPLLIALILLTLVLALGHFGTDITGGPLGEATFTLGTATSLVIGIYVLGAVMSPDVARWARSRRDAAIASFVGFSIGNSFVLIVAVILARIMETQQVIGVFMAVGLGIPSLLVLTLAQWTTNTSNLYSASLGFANLAPRVPRVAITLVVGVAASLMAYLGLFDSFITYLTIMTILITPIGGVYIAEYFFVDKTRFVSATPLPQPLVARSTVSWLLGSGLCLATTPQPDGLGWFDLSTIPALDGLVLALIVQTALGRLTARREPVAR